MYMRGALELSACPDKETDIILALSVTNGADVLCLHADPDSLRFIVKIQTRAISYTRTCTDTAAALGAEGPEWERRVNREGFSLSLSYNLRVKLGLRCRN